MTILHLVEESCLECACFPMLFCIVIGWPPPYYSSCHKGSTPFFLLLPFMCIT